MTAGTNPEPVQNPAGSPPKAPGGVPSWLTPTIAVAILAASFAYLNVQLTTIANRSTSIESRIDSVDRRVAGLDDKVEKRADGIDRRLEGVTTRLDKYIDAQSASQAQMQRIEPDFKYLRDRVDRLADTIQGGRANVQGGRTPIGVPGFPPESTGSMMSPEEAARIDLAIKFLYSRPEYAHESYDGVFKIGDALPSSIATYDIPNFMIPYLERFAGNKFSIVNNYLIFSNPSNRIVRSTYKIGPA